MSDTNPTTTAVTDAGEMEQLLEALAGKLEQQISLVEAEDYDAFLEIGEEVDTLLKQVCGATAPLTHVAFQTIQRIHGLHQKLGLNLSSRSKESADQLQKVRTGRNAAKAYQRAQ